MQQPLVAVGSPEDAPNTWCYGDEGTTHFHLFHLFISFIYLFHLFIYLIYFIYECYRLQIIPGQPHFTPQVVLPSTHFHGDVASDSRM